MSFTPARRNINRWREFLEFNLQIYYKFYALVLSSVNVNSCKFNLSNSIGIQSDPLGMHIIN